MTHRLRVVLEHFARFLIVADFFDALALEIPALHLLKKAGVPASHALQDRAGAIFVKKHWKQREPEVVWSANHALSVTSDATLTNTHCAFTPQAARASKWPEVIHFQCEPAARAARRVLDGESVEESWNQVNFMLMSYDAVRRQPIGM